jgi:hypothetical protein
MVAFLDDASTDDSISVAAPLLAALPCPHRIERNALRSGSVISQWQLGLSLLDTEFIWIAEADDSARPGLLAGLAALLREDPAAAFAFSDSIAIGRDGEVLAENGKAYAAALGDRGLDVSSSFSGQDFLARFLCPRNLVVSASAVLWRASALRDAFVRLGPAAAAWLCAGDWRLYAQACRDGRRVHYLDEPLNLHRRHGSSVTGRTSAVRRFAEVVAMHGVLRRMLPHDPAREAAMRQHVCLLRRLWLADTKQEEGLPRRA